jgi:TRAP-type C4-dicarboxylate transport system permease small subunit
MWLAFARAIDKAVAWTLHVVLYLTTAAIFLILSVNVVLRYTTGASLQWASEVPELLFPWLIVAGVVLAAQHGTHICVVIVTRRLSRPLQHWVWVGGSTAVAALYAMLSLAAWDVMLIAHDEKSPILHIPGSTSVAALLFGFVLLALVTITRLVIRWQDGRAAAVDDEFLAQEGR